MARLGAVRQALACARWITVLCAVLWMAGPVRAQPPSAAAELLVRWSASAARPVAMLDSLHAASGLQRLDRLLPVRRVAAPAAVTGAPRRAVSDDNMARWVRLRFDGTVPLAELMRRYGAVPGVESLQPNFLRQHAAYRTDDPRLDEQWNLEAVGWRQRDPGSALGVLVAIIDSGVDAAHPDLAMQIWHNTIEQDGVAGVDDDGNGYVDDVAGWDFADAPGLPGDGDFLEPDNDPDDESGHGTHVAGIVAATSNNGLGVAGVAPGAMLMVLRAGFNIGGTGYLQDDDIAAAIVYAADNGARIINLSLGDPRYSPLLADAVRYATNRDVVVVAAAGNERSAEVFYPARLDETIGVAAAGRDGRPAAFSNFGNSIDLSAPGVAILSTQPGGGYGQLSGTSMAAPHVAAAAALIAARHPEYDRLQITGALMQAASDNQAPGWDAATGHGAVLLPSLTASAPLAVELQTPAPERPTSAAQLQIAASYDSPANASYNLAWALDQPSPLWQAIESGSLIPGRGVLAAAWTMTTLPPGQYVVRLQVRDDAGRSHEDRLAVHRVTPSEAVEDLRHVRLLQGPRWHDVVEWRSASSSSGSVRIVRDEETLWNLPTPPGDTSHVVRLPPDLAPGTYDIQVRADSTATPVATSLRVDPVGILRWNLHTLAPERADGYVLPQVTDFDADGSNELAAMIYGGGAYGATSFFAWPRAEPVFTTTRLFIPWHSGDLDLDGRPDLLAVDARRVRLLEAAGPVGFPTAAVWEMRDVWGGEVADLDGDARPEMVLRSATGALFRVFESDGDDRFRETAALVNDTPGDNEMGDRQSVGDFDGDGRGEWVSGDSDGDLMVFESVGDDAYRRIWHDIIDADHVDGRLLSAAADLDGDGLDEFISGRLLRDPFDVEGRRWTLTVYGARADKDNAYQAEWQVQVLAGSGSGNGLAVGDVDGDGRVEWIAALIPHLYVFRSDGNGGYEPVWHTQVRRTQRPAIGDLDGDGRNELTYNQPAGGLVSVRWPVPEAPLSAPTSWTATATGVDRVQLTWESVPGAAAYHLHRDGTRIARIEAEAAPVHVDSARTPGATYLYQLAAVDSAGATGQFTPELAATPQGLPRVLAAQRTSATRILVDFDRPMGSSAADAFRYQLFTGAAAVLVGHAESVILDRSDRRAVVSFSGPVADHGDSLKFPGVRAADGAPLDAGLVPVVDAAMLPATRIRRASAPSPGRIVVLFDRSVRIDTGQVVVDGGMLQVRSIAVGQDARTVEIMLEPSTPLRPLGRRYAVEISGLADDLERPVAGRIFVTLQAEQLDELIVFPNPVDPQTQSLTAAGLPTGTRVTIHTIAGELLWSGVEEDGDGGLQWNGLNDRGGRVASGVYLLTASHDGTVRRARIALLRRP